MCQRLRPCGPGDAVYCLRQPRGAVVEPIAEKLARSGKTWRRGAFPAPASQALDKSRRAAAAANARLGRQIWFSDAPKRADRRKRAQDRGGTRPGDQRNRQVDESRRGSTRPWRAPRWTVVPYQARTTPAAHVGNQSETSAMNKISAKLGFHNCFRWVRTCFRNNAVYNPTGPGALAYGRADAIQEPLSEKNPGLVSQKMRLRPSRLQRRRCSSPPESRARTAIPKHGQRKLFERGHACHAFGGAQGVGRSRTGFSGDGRRRWTTYRYSPRSSAQASRGRRNAGAYIEDPQSRAGQIAMPYAGMPEERDRADLILVYAGGVSIRGLPAFSAGSARSAPFAAVAEPDLPVLNVHCSCMLRAASLSGLAGRGGCATPPGFSPAQAFRRSASPQLRAVAVGIYRHPFRTAAGAHAGASHRLADFDPVRRSRRSGPFGQSRVRPRRTGLCRTRDARGISANASSRATCARLSRRDGAPASGACSA